ncbi:hypothetical protein ACI5KX_04095 [Erythrobacter sp. GH1-10]|uniref:hypothetical protein n=1 Tax=Erythrobacter sp. GH1-10 TaxID=3349334 RepID=UPI0038782518
MLELIVEYRDDAQHIASILLGLAMWRWGGAPEKIVALTFVVLFTLPNMITGFVSGGALLFIEGGTFYAGIDVVAAVIFVAVALNANRNYTLWIAGFQLVATFSHAVRFMVDVVSPLAHAMMVIGPSYFQLILMTAGLVRHIRREKRHGSYRDWRITPKQPWDLVEPGGGPKGGI